MSRLNDTSMVKPKLSKSEIRAEITNRAARAIIGAESARLTTKTARLRKARLESEAEMTKSAPPSKLRAGRRRAGTQS
ncbi:MAG: hypothetical protein Rhirs2KO_20040 [Rhizobiaceae bacterium]